MNTKSELLIIFFCSVLNNVELASAAGRQVSQHSVQTPTSLALVSASKGSWLCPQTMTEQLHCSGGYVSSKVMCGCVTVNETEAVMTVGQCPYGCSYLNTAEDKYSNGLDLCKHFNRRGSLCSSCSAGYYPRLHSYDLHCVACTGKIVTFLWKYFVFVLLPLSIFYFVIVYLNLNILMSPFHGYIMFCVVLCSPMFSRVYLMKIEGSSRFVRMCMKFVLSVCGIWSLDFFYFYDHKLCLHTNTLVALALNYIVGVYPLLLMLATLGLTMLYDENFKLLVLVWKPFKCFFHVFKDNWDIKTSIVDTFVSFLIMCSVKFIGVCFDLLVPVRVYQYSPFGNVSSSWRLYYDAEVLYFGRDHLPYAILALVVFFIFTVIPVLIFICYAFGFYQRLLQMFPRRWQVFLHTFMDAFQGCYKNGSEFGTRDCRWFSVVPCLVHFSSCLSYAAALSTSIFPLLSVIFVVAGIVTIQVNPFKRNQERLFVLFVVFSLLGGLVYNNLSSVEVSLGKTQNVGTVLQYLTIFLALSCLTVYLVYRTIFGCKKLFWS